MNCKIDITNSYSLSLRVIIVKATTEWRPGATSNVLGQHFSRRQAREDPGNKYYGLNISSSGSMYQIL